MRDDHVRASDEEREATLEVLKEAMANGMLDINEFDERSARVMASRTRGELAEVVADLPITGGAPTPEDNRTVEFTGTFNSVKRKGDWDVPRRIMIRKNMGSTELDFTEANIAHPVVDIEIEVNGGSLQMRVPDEASVDFNGVELTLASAEDHRKRPPQQGKPHFRLTGAMRVGSIEVRGRPWRPFTRKR
ncbi:DUF1707 SHOCT-like domain-containing protein [Sciscionella marina]|uniref:DUF1707 SHOCT-like domain-containing protein n=1 Tax=Sciscionella marina TaxID=508770 RepID=UPI0003661028|nr:DUF1707 domain-containing protein [Sciscionella marina]